MRFFLFILTILKKDLKKKKTVFTLLKTNLDKICIFVRLEVGLYSEYFVINEIFKFFICSSMGNNSNIEFAIPPTGRLNFLFSCVL